MKDKKSSVELIASLCNAFGPSGCEEMVADLICERIAPICEEVRRDRLGNVIARLDNNDGGRKKLMISAHMDEVGFMINEIGEDGSLRFTTVGGISTPVMSAKQVRVGNEKGQINGLISSKAIHLKPKDDRLKPEKAEKMYIDIGASSAEAAEELAPVGSFATFAPNFSLFGKDNKMMHSKALDDRLGCALIIELMESLKEQCSSLPLDIYFCFTVREEVGLSGAEVAANVIKPDYAIVLETTAVADIFGVDDSMRVSAVGGGGVISLMDRSTIYDKDLVRMALDVAKENGIAVQVKKYVSGGNDAAHIHKSGKGVKTLALSAPTRYLHSPNCVASLDDYDAMLALLEKIILTGRLN